MSRPRRHPATFARIACLGLGLAWAGAPALVYGANWTIEVDTAPVAESAASATGGTVAPPA